MSLQKKIGVGLLIMTGVFIGVGLYTFHYGEGLSYFSTDPKACMNCHIMKPQFNSWQKSSHHTSAVCVDCHLPTTFIAKYIAKADNGYRHSKGFTFQDFEEPITIKPANEQILQDNCVRCHQGLIHQMTLASKDDFKTMRCTHCHSDVGHGPRASMGRIYQDLMREDFKQDER